MPRYSRRKSVLKALKSFRPLPDPVDIAETAVRNDLNPAGLSEEAALFKRCPNILSWISSKEFVGITPYPRQVEITLNFYQDYCPWCSTHLDPQTGLLQDCWGMSLSEITSKVAVLHDGICPVCNRTKADMMLAGSPSHLQPFNELVGVAGQRCLHPDTRIATPRGAVALKDALVGDKILTPSGKVTTIKKKWTQQHQGCFSLVYMIGKSIHEIQCSDCHNWVIYRKGVRLEVPTSELRGEGKQSGDEIPVYFTANMESRALLLAVNKKQKPIELIDIEVDSPDSLYLAHDGLVLHNSGKSTMVGLFATYHLHRAIMLPVQPALYYGLTAKSALFITFVATTVKQAADTIWSSFIDSFSSSQWFRDYLLYLNNLTEKDGVQRYKWLETFITFREKRIKVEFMSPRSEGLRGATRIFAAIDEWGLFPADEDLQHNGFETYRSLNNSLRTIRSATSQLLRDKKEINPLDGMMCNISSPIDENDPIMTQLDKCRHSTGSMYGFHYATWEVNPRITREDLNDEFLTDPVLAARDFGAVPPVTTGGFIARSEALDALIEPERKPIAEVMHTRFSQTILDTTYQYVRAGLRAFEPKPNTAYLVTVDAGESNNSFGIMLSHWDLSLDRGVVDLVVDVEPEVTAEGQVARVHFPSALNFIIGGEGKETPGLIQCCPVWKVAYDRWQSTDHIQKIRDKGVQAEVYSLRFNDFTKFRGAIYNGNWILPEPEQSEKNYPNPPATMPVLRLIRQAKRVRQSGLRITKPTTGSDDLFRCWALASHMYEEYRKEYADFQQSTSVTTLHRNNVHRVRIVSSATQDHQRYAALDKAKSVYRVRPS